MCQVREVAGMHGNENRPAFLLTHLGWKLDERWGQAVGKDDVHVCKPFQQHPAWGLMLSKINENISALLVQPAHLLTPCNTEIDHCRQFIGGVGRGLDPRSPGSIPEPVWKGYTCYEPCSDLSKGAWLKFSSKMKGRTIKPKCDADY